MIAIGHKDLQDLESALEREWLETNGLGGYASSTVLGINTRKYHGLLVAALRPPVDRALLVSRVDEALIVGDSRFELAASEYQDTVYPDGFRYLEEFRLDPFPTLVYQAGGVILRKRIFMVHGHNTTCLTYSIEPLPGGPPRDRVKLEIRPLLAFRDHHGLLRETPEFDVRVERLEPSGGAGGHLLCTGPVPHLPPVYVAFGCGEFAETGYWYRNYRYRREAESGYASNEDLYSPGALTLAFGKADPHVVVFSTEEAAAPDAGLAEAEAGRRATLVKGPLEGHELGRRLVGAADAFIVRRSSEGRTVIAGYPWFTDWGRDTMISLPGLTLAAGRPDDAGRILQTYAAAMEHGLIPNLFPDFAASARYNTVDATLWFFEAVRKYYDATADGELVTAILPSLREAMRSHIRGTLYGIKADDDGLLRSGEEGAQLTWMDAKFEDEVITARTGKPVEINALWFNAMRIMAGFCGDFGGLAEERAYDEMAAKTLKAFNRKFWNDDLGCLYDSVDVHRRDDSVRPNQVIAMSLTYPVLDPSRWRPVVDLVERELLTPYGLRTLSPNDPRYRGRYDGDLKTRDHAYHQGTVWPWLMGPYMRAYLLAHGRSEATRAHCLRLLEPLARHLDEAGLGQISEIFDGDPPHRPHGCIAQAWSVAEMLRVLSEDLQDPALRRRAEALRSEN
ncbi:MAG: amylo-alpha-1,6-glucosidase [bacterium]